MRRISLVDSITTNYRWPVSSGADEVNYENVGTEI